MRIPGVGSVRLDGLDGDLLRVVNAARTSFRRRDTEMTKRGYEIVREMGEQGHTSPSRHVHVTYTLRIPFYVFNQLIKHRRGVDWGTFQWLRPLVFAMPVLREKPETARQGSGGEMANSTKCQEIFSKAVSHGLRAGEDEEMCIPLAALLEVTVTVSLPALKHLIDLRCDPHAQKETRLVVEAMADLLAEADTEIDSGMRVIRTKTAFDEVAEFQTYGAPEAEDMMVSQEFTPVPVTPDDPMEASARALINEKGYGEREWVARVKGLGWVGLVGGSIGVSREVTRVEFALLIPAVTMARLWLMLSEADLNAASLRYIRPKGCADVCQEGYAAAVDAYHQIVAGGACPEQARAVLPVGTHYSAMLNIGHGDYRRLNYAGFSGRAGSRGLYRFIDEILRIFREWLNMASTGP